MKLSILLAGSILTSAIVGNAYARPAALSHRVPIWDIH